MYTLDKFSKSVEDKISSKLENFWGKEIFKPGLDAIKLFIKDHPFKKNPNIITIAGTNGKGETSRFASFLLQKMNKSVCLWTSPHLVSVLERFYSSQDGLITYSELETFIDEVESWQHKNKIQLSYYELLFCCFILWVNKLSPEFVVLEVGLGGRLDAVNAFEADIAAITSIARDHQEILGTRYEQILFEKFGVCRKKTKLYTGFETQYLNQKTKELVDKLGCQWQKVSWEKDEDFSWHNRRLAAALVGFSESLEDYRQTSLNPVLGEQNIDGKKIRFYGSHNPEGLRKLVQFLQTCPYTNKDSFDVLLFSLSRRKIEDIKIIMEIISQLNIPKKVFVPLIHHKGQSYEEIASILEDNDFEVCHKPVKEYFKSLPEGTRILATGSNYFIGDFYTQISFGQL